MTNASTFLNANAADLEEAEAFLVVVSQADGTQTAYGPYPTLEKADAEALNLQAEVLANSDVVIAVTVVPLIESPWA